MELYADPIEVELDESRRVLAGPKTFVWREQRYVVERIIKMWSDSSRPDQRRRKHGWWERRHRDYFRVQTESGEVWDIYRDRGGRRRLWYLSRRWDPSEEGNV